MKKKKYPDPVEYIKFVMGQMNWKQVDLVKFGCRCKSHVSEILNRKRKITLNFIRCLVKKRECILEILIQDYKL